MLLFAIICLPVGPLKKWLDKQGFPKIAKTIALVVLFLFSMWLAPTEDTGTLEDEQPAVSASAPSDVSTEEPDDIEPEEPETVITPDVSPISTTTPEPDPEPTPTATSEPEPEPASTPTSEPEPTPTPTPSQDASIRGRSASTTVYVSNRSNTIHSQHDCSGMKNYREMTLGEADAKGYKYCDMCW